MKTAIVTGCGRGLGNALLDQLDGLGYLVAGATHGQMDVTSQISVVNFAFDFAQKHSSLDLLINNAAVILDSKDILSVTPGMLQDTMEVNALGPLFVCQAHWKLLKAAHGLIINISSSDAECLDECRPAYSISKAALEAVTKKLALAGKRDGVRVVSVHPGWFRSGMGGPNAPLSPEEAAANVLKLL